MKNRKPKVIVKCLDCDHTREVAPWQARAFVRCKSCAAIENYKKSSIEQNKKRLLALSIGRSKWIEENKNLLSDRGKYARSKVNKENASSGRHKQHKTISNDPEKYEKYCEKRRKIATDFHNLLNSNSVLKEDHYKKVFGSKTSKAEENFFSVLESIGIVAERQKMISGFFVDGYFPEASLVIEFYGDAHHCSPKKFKDPERFCSWINRTVSEQWLRDRRRLAALYKIGCKVLIIWQTDWDKNREVQIERIRDALFEN